MSISVYTKIEREWESSLLESPFYTGVFHAAIKRRRIIVKGWAFLYPSLPHHEALGINNLTIL